MSIHNQQPTSYNSSFKIYHRWYDSVRDFHLVFEHPTPGEYTNRDDYTKPRHSFIQEEVEELQTAFKNKDIVEFADAIVDILYFSFGALIIHGVGWSSAKKPMYPLYDNNRLDPSVCEFYKRDADILAYTLIPDIFSTPKYIKTLNEGLMWYRYCTFDRQNKESYIESQEVFTLKTDKKPYNYPYIVICDIISLTLSIASYHGLSLEVIDALFYEVHRSNMSKLDENGKPIYNEQGKVMKSKNYVKPDIKGVLNYFGIDKWQ